MADDAKDSGRDTRGRFAPGNPGGPGGARRRSFELRRAAQEAITEEHIQAMMRKAAAMALQGSLPAMRFVFERTSGRAAEAPADPEPVAIAMPDLRTAADCNLAMERLMAAVCSGTIDRDTAKVLTDMVQVRIKVIETKELEERVERMEKTAAQQAAHRASNEPLL